jgi:HD-like signal output (HDOD) protein
MGIAELRQLARGGERAAEALAAALARVPGLADEVLRIANRSELRCGPRIAAVERAVVLLGARPVAEIALAILEAPAASLAVPSPSTMEA